MEGWKTRRRNFLATENKIKDSQWDFLIQRDGMFSTVPLLLLLSDSGYLSDNVVMKWLKVQAKEGDYIKGLQYVKNETVY